MVMKEVQMVFVLLNNYDYSKIHADGPFVTQKKHILISIFEEIPVGSVSSKIEIYNWFTFK